MRELIKRLYPSATDELLAGVLEYAGSGILAERIDDAAIRMAVRACIRHRMTPYEDWLWAASAEEYDGLPAPLADKLRRINAAICEDLEEDDYCSAERRLEEIRGVVLSHILPMVDQIENEISRQAQS